MQVGKTFTFHDKYLYATNPSQQELVYRFDLTIPVDEAKKMKTTIIGEKSRLIAEETSTWAQYPVVVSMLPKPQSSNATKLKQTTKPKKKEELPKSKAAEPKEKKESVKLAEPPLQCEFCHESLTESKTFNCEFCAEKDNKLEVFVCGTCVVKNHGDHFTSVKSVIFADSVYRTEKIGHVSREPATPSQKNTAHNATITAKVTAELNSYMEKLQKDFEKVNNKVTSLMAKASISKKAMDKETEEVLKDEAVIVAKMEKLEDWVKEVVECVSKLNKEYGDNE